MLCEFTAEYATNPLIIWLSLILVASSAIMITSSAVFIESYVYARHERWQFKTNPTYPSVSDVREEILMTIKGVIVATIPPTMTFYLTNRGFGKAYCGWEDDQYEITQGYGGKFYLIATFFISWIGSDWYEFFYHRLGHTKTFCWNVHRHHHAYYNPTPFAVIADEAVDQFMRALPLLIFPMAMPINMDMLFAMYGSFFYIYGVYLHWGHEFAHPWPTAHHPWINTSFQHYIHHAKSIMNKPYHTGFFFKIWDQMVGSIWHLDDALIGTSGKTATKNVTQSKPCLCANCCRARGERSKEAWAKTVVPDYRELLDWKLWVYGGKKHKKAFLKSD